MVQLIECKHKFRQILHLESYPYPYQATSEHHMADMLIELGELKAYRCYVTTSERHISSNNDGDDSCLCVETTNEQATKKIKTSKFIIVCAGMFFFKKKYPFNLRHLIKTMNKDSIAISA